MSQSYNILICIFENLPEIEKEVMDFISENSYDEESGFSFESVTLTKRQIEGILIERSSTYLSEFDLSTRDFKQREVSIYNQV